MGISSSLGSSALLPAGLGFRNVLINGDFRINQRGYTSASNLASGSYGFDRWKSTFTNTTLTFTSAPQGQIVTINSGGSIKQIVERENITAGTFVLSWTGTATGRVYNTGATPPAYAASPITVTLDGLANVEVEFTASGGTQTLWKPQLEQNRQPTPFEQRPIGIELELCMRYYEDSILPLSIAGSYAAGLGGNTYVSAVFFKVPKRIGVTTINGSTDSPGVLRLWNGVLGTLGSVAIYRGGWAHPTTIGADLSSSFGFSLTTQGSTTDAAMAWFRYAFSAEL